MEAKQLKTVDDLDAYPDERVELVDGEIVSHEAIDCAKVRIPPFDEVEIDLAYIFGDEPHETGN